MSNDTDITVTTATQTEAEVRAAFDLPAAEVPPVAPVVAPAAAAAAVPPVAASPTPEEQEADSARPDTEVSEAARTLRSNRSDARKAKIQSEIDELTKRKHATLTEVTDLERRRAQLAAPPAAAPAAAAPAAGAAPPADSSAPSFVFPAWDEYQTAHPDADYTEYTDARTDARYAYNRQRDDDARAQETAARQDREAATVVNTAREAFQVEHPDYDAVVATLRVDPESPQYLALQRLMLKAGKDAPAITYYLGQHHDEARRLLAADKPTELSRLFGQIELKAVHASAFAPAPAAVPPSKPATAAPAPMGAIPASVQTTRTLQEIAADDEDADSYIAVRTKQMKATG